ncbi:hypothetical protein DRN67_03300, partial [Candidatus Micrarchaeota archaeon]
MEIISVSLEAEDVKKVREIMESLGIKSRSKLIRASLDSLVKEYEVLSELEGSQTVVFMISKKNGKSDVSKIMHEFQGVIKTNIHHHSPKGCLDILITEGDANVIRSM